MLDNFLIQLFHEGKSLEAYKVFGAHLETVNKEKGVRFTVYAPNAKSVQVIGDFNEWDGHDHVMENYNGGGVYTLFIPSIEQYDIYKYRIETQSGAILDKADPYAFFSELRPATASKVYNLEGYKWADKRWLNKRTKNFNKVLNIYEANIGSWKMKKDFTDEEDGEFYSYEEMIDLLIPYVVEHGYSHIELMPLTEYPFDGSWGYQVTGFFSATSRYGNPKQLMDFVNACHKNNIGVIMDFVPAHFVTDAHGLIQFDGGFLYESADIHKRYTEWDSCYFDFAKDEVKSFLMSAVHFWSCYFHIDGIRFDAVSNLIFYKGNKDLGENKDAIEFMKRMNESVSESCPGVMLIAEDSSDYPKVTAPVKYDGLGFDYKWDLGWMNDTLTYFKKDPVYRQYDDIHYKLTFSMMYFHSENYILPFSHDEVVHGKGTILDKMWGENDTKFAQCKALYLYMMTHPGKKLNFMGNELAEYKEWDEKKSLGWGLLDFPQHDSFRTYIKDLNAVVNDYPALYERDYDAEGFEWLIVDDKKQSIFAYARKDAKDNILVCVMNFIGNTHEKYTIPVPKAGSYKEIINTDKDIYTGSDITNKRAVRSKKMKALGFDNVIQVKIAPFSGMIFELKKDK